MAKQPKSWRTEAGLSLAYVAERAGITGTNPSRTYDRYERGQNICPAEVIEKVRGLSEGKVDAESWQQVRLAYLRTIVDAKAAEARP